MKPFSIILAGLFVCALHCGLWAASTESVKKAYSPYDQERKDVPPAKTVKPPSAAVKEQAKPAAKKDSAAEKKSKASGKKASSKKEKSKEKTKSAFAKKETAKASAKGKAALSAKAKGRMVLPPPSIKTSTSVPTITASAAPRESKPEGSAQVVKPLPPLADDPRAKDLEQPFNWRVDKHFRYQIAFVDEHPRTKCHACAKAYPFALSEAGKPEPGARPLNSLQDEGYPVPERDSAQDYKLYFKSYQWPKGFSPGEIISPMMESFGLDRLRGGDSLIFFGSNRESLMLRHGIVALATATFSEGEAFPPLLLENSRDARNAFYRTLSCSTLFIRPVQWEEKFKDDNERAEYSIKGLREFHRQLVAGYKASLTEIHCSESDRTLCFEDTRCYATKERPCRAILKLPREISVFPDWRSRPLPTDPAHHFLGSMFTVYRLQTDPASGSLLPPAAMLEAVAAIRVP